MRFRIAAFKFLNRGLKQLRNGYAQPTNLSLNVTALTTPITHLPASPSLLYKLGRRLLEVSAPIRRRLCRKAFRRLYLQGQRGYLCALKRRLMLDSLQAPLTEAHCSVGRFVNAAKEGACNPEPLLRLDTGLH